MAVLLHNALKTTQRLTLFCLLAVTQHDTHDFGGDILDPQLKSLSVLGVCLSVLSETADSTEEEWQSIADLATACRSILEALSREGEDHLIQTHLLVKHAVVF